MNILVIAYLFPYPADGGYKLRVYNTIKELSYSNDIDLLCFVTGDCSQEQRQHMQSYCKNIWVLNKPAITATTKLCRYILNCFKSVPYVLFSAWDYEKNEFTKRIVATNNYNVIIAEHLIAAHTLYTSNLQLDKHILHVVVNHNVESDLYRTIAIKKNPLLIPFIQIKYFFLKNYEKKINSNFDLSISMSKIDKAIFEKMCPQTKIIVLPNGVDTELYYYRNKLPSNNDIYYAGSFNYYPNVDAIHYFMNDIFPAIKTKINNVRFFIVGGNPPEDIQNYHDGKRVYVLGYQPDIRLIMERCAISVVPLRLGGGTRLKVVEAMSMGIPTVSTSKGAEGLQVTHQKDIIIADEPQKFISHTVELLMNPQMQIQIGLAGRKTAMEQYSWKALIKIFKAELLRGVL
jgi:polysaccharide biosynthesis protein PslH